MSDVYAAKPVKVSDNYRDYKVIEKFDFSAIYEDCPVEVLDAYSFYNINTYKYFVNIILINTSEKEISELTIRLLCFANQNIPYEKLLYTFSVNKNNIGKPEKEKKFKLNLPFKKKKKQGSVLHGEEFGHYVYISLPDSYFQKMKLEFVSVKYSDGTVEDLSKSKQLKYTTYDQLSEDNRFAYHRMNIYNVAEEEHPIRVIPMESGNTWLCCCGTKNISSDKLCKKCMRDKDWQLKNLTEESFDKTLVTESADSSPEFVHYRKAIRTPVSLGLETQEEVDRKIKEYEKVLENVAKREREKERMIYGIFLRLGIAAAVIFLLIFILKLIQIL